MTVTFTLRTETPADIGAITEVTMAAFETLAISQQTEHFIVAALRAAGALTLSLVAESGGQVIGHIGFSPVVLSDGTPDWYGLGPVSVLPAFQRQGVGRALMDLARAHAPTPLYFGSKPGAEGFYEKIGCERSLPSFLIPGAGAKDEE